MSRYFNEYEEQAKKLQAKVDKHNSKARVAIDKMNQERLAGGTKNNVHGRKAMKYFNKSQKEECLMWFRVEENYLLSVHVVILSCCPWTSNDSTP